MRFVSLTFVYWHVDMSAVSQFIHKCQSQTNSFWVKPDIRVQAGFWKKFPCSVSWHSWHCAFNSGDPFLYVTLYMKSFQVLLVTLHKTSNNIWKMVVGRWFSLLHRWNMWSFPGGYALCIFVHDIPVEILVEHDLHQVSENMISTTSVQEKAAEESVLTMY